MCSQLDLRLKHYKKAKKCVILYVDSRNINIPRELSDKGTYKKLFQKTFFLIPKVSYSLFIYFFKNEFGTLNLDFHGQHKTTWLIGKFLILTYPSTVHMYRSFCVLFGYFRVPKDLKCTTSQPQIKVETGAKMLADYLV